MSGSATRTAGPTLEQRAEQLGADLVFEGGGVKGIGLAGAVITLDRAGYVFPRCGGTSAGAIVAALVAAYQTAGVPLSQIETDLHELDYRRFKATGRLERWFGRIGQFESLMAHQGIYRTSYLHEWLHGKLDPIGIRTFGDLRITDDPGTSLPPEQRYRLVVHTSDLSRQCLVRLPWDLPEYLLPDVTTATEAEQLAVIDAYPVVDAVRASMSIPFFFQPFVQSTAHGTCTWVDGGLLQNFPVTVFDRTDGRPNRWPTFGIKLSGRPPLTSPDRAITGTLEEFLAVAHTALGEWNRYALVDGGVDSRTMWVDTAHVSATDFALDRPTQDRLYANGQVAAQEFLATWVATAVPVG